MNSVKAVAGLAVRARGGVREEGSGSGSGSGYFQSSCRRPAAGLNSITLKLERFGEQVLDHNKVQTQVELGLNSG